MKKLVALFGSGYSRRHRFASKNALNNDVSRIYGREGVMFWR